jgi:hypothetical protein
MALRPEQLSLLESCESLSACYQMCKHLVQCLSDPMVQYFFAAELPLKHPSVRVLHIVARPDGAPHGKHESDPSLPDSNPH